MGEAIPLMIKAIADMVTEIVKEQPIEVKQKLWEWYVKDIEMWRKILGLEK